MSFLGVMKGDFRSAVGGIGEERLDAIFAILKFINKKKELLI